MTKKPDEVWGITPFDTKAHLYFSEDGAVRRLCHRSRFTDFDPVPARELERCRLCLNIRGKLITRRQHKIRPGGPA
jgi:hypothetical protein